MRACWLSRHRLGLAIVVALAVEMPARMALLTWVGPYVAYMSLNPALAAMGSTYGERVVVELILCVPGLAVLSAELVAAVRPKQLAARLMSAPSILSAGHAPSLEAR